MSLEGESEKVRRFEKYILVYLADLYRAARRLTGQASDAEDLVQETCLRAFKALDQLKYLPAAKAWVFSILRSVFLRQAQRTSARGTQVSLEDIDASLLTPGDTIHDAYESLIPLRQLLLHEARDAILNLPVPYREAVILAHVGGFSYREMAQILDVPTGTVMSRLFRGRRLLRAYLGQCSSRSGSAQ